MDIKHLAALAGAIIASSSWAAGPADAKCGAGTCGKKEKSAPKDASTKDAACSKKDAEADKKEAACAKKDAACAKKDAACAKK